MPMDGEQSKQSLSVDCSIKLMHARTHSRNHARTHARTHTCTMSRLNSLESQRIFEPGLLNRVGLFKVMGTHLKSDGRQVPGEFEMDLAL